MTAIVRDTRTVLARELRPQLREPVSLVFSLIQPLFFLALFGPLLTEVGTLGGGDDSLQWFVPGILVMSALFASSMTGSSLSFEINTGSHERMLVTPLARPALLIGRAMKEIVPIFVQALLVVAAVLPFGFAIAPEAVLGLLMLAVFGIGLGALSYTLALAVQGEDWIFWTVQQTLLYPLMLLSGMLLPTDSGPGWLQALAAANPLKYIVDAERELFAGNLADPSVAYGGLAAVAVAAVGLTVGVRAMRRAAA